MKNKQIGLLFAGQGSQYPGMGLDFYQTFDFVQKMYKEASEILSYDISEICFTENFLMNQTEYTQPAILLVTCSIYEVLKRKGLNVVAGCGFSLGEYSALYASGVFDFRAVVSLIKKRAYYMHACANKTDGAMAAIIGLDLKSGEELCKETDTKIANYNSPIQFVIAGKKDKVLLAMEKATEYGAKRVVMLNVSGAFHHPLMKEAALDLKPYLIEAPKKEPNFPVIMNCDALPLEIDDLSDKLEKQIYSPVRFEESVRFMVEKYQVDMLLEIGPGKVLSGLSKRIVPGVRLMNIEKLDDFNTFIKEELNESN
jgi:[acyl-carrier-protein] S-malonyltransferase